MSSVEIKKVADKKGLRDFIDFHHDLYKGNLFDAPNLFSDDMHTLSKDKNAAFEFCEAEYFLAYKNGKLVGRIAAIINHRANERWERKSVRFGWVDFIDDEEVPVLRANYILRAVEIPAGKHTIEFRCKDELLQKSQVVSVAASALIALIILLLLIFRRKIE